MDDPGDSIRASQRPALDARILSRVKMTDIGRCGVSEIIGAYRLRRPRSRDPITQRSLAAGKTDILGSLVQYIQASASFGPWPDIDQGCHRLFPGNRIGHLDLDLVALDRTCEFWIGVPDAFGVLLHHIAEMCVDRFRWERYTRLIGVA